MSPEFGLTYRLIEEDGFYINQKVEMLLSSDTPIGIVKTMGVGMIGYADAYDRLKPDAIIILGDRYEMLAVAAGASIFKIPIIHIHGGEITEGAYDDSIRHSISKLSHIHFTSTAEYRERVIQMGEHPERVFNVGAIGLDNINSLNLLSREELSREINVKFKKYNYQVTFHPETLGDISSEEQFDILLKAINQQKDSFFIFTKANADTDGRVINQMIDQYVSENPEKAISFKSLGTLRFLSLVNCCDAILGNSSSGIIEAPSLKTPTINIGDRQKGRIQSKSIINCSIDEESILAAIKQVKSIAFKEEVKSTINPYGNGDASTKIIHYLRKIDWGTVTRKSFYNLKQIQ